MWGVSTKLGALFSSPHNKDYSLLESTLGAPVFWKLPCLCIFGAALLRMRLLEEQLEAVAPKGLPRILRRLKKLESL